MQSALVTIVVVPRERFSIAPHSLESIYQHTTGAFELVYVDGASPRAVSRWLDQAATQYGFRLLRTRQYLMPNQARNIGLAEVKTKYVVFIDNDVIVWPGWLEPLIECAEETGAWAVGPVICIGKPGEVCIHVTHGELHITESHGRRELDEEMCHINEHYHDIKHQLIRAPCDFVEFHCMLARRDAFERVGNLDEKIMTTREHIDFCLAIEKAEGTVFFEPTSCVTHVPPWHSFSYLDLPYYLLRWNDKWAYESVQHFVRKWGLPDDTQKRLTEWILPHRRAVFDPVERAFRPALLRRYIGRPFTQLLAAAMERLLVPLARRKGRASAALVRTAPDMANSATRITDHSVL